MSAGAVRAGGVFVEIGADPRKFFAALTKVNKSLASMGGSLVSGGGRLAAAGIGMAAPIAAAVRQGAAFESTLLNIRASTGATSAEIDKIKSSAMQMSQALGVGPTEAAGGMLELLKAGMSLDAVLGGAGKTALEFAKVGEMDVAQAAVVMSDAMNVFKVSSDVAANALSSAADASSTSIAQMSEAFSMSSAVAGLANQSIEDLSATLAILANNGVKGSDAGTSIKTMLMRLMAPADDAVGALDQLGLSVASFRGADGQMRPMVEIIGTLNQAMSGLDQTAKDDIFRRIFGADAIRAASILAASGVDGFNGMRDAMKSALPVGEKYKLLMSGLAGSAGNVLAALQRMAISVSDAVAPALASVVPFITGFIDGLTKLATDNKEAVVLFAQVAAAVIGVGAAMVTVGYSLQALSGGIGLVLKGFGLFSALASPVLLVAAGIGAAVFALYKFKDQIGAALGPVASLVQQAAGAIGEGFSPAVADGIVVLNDLAATATTTFSGIYEAVAAGDLAGAMDVLWAGLHASWLRGVEALMSYVDPLTSMMQNTFTYLAATVLEIWDGMLNRMAAGWDAMESNVRKGWNFLNAAFQGGDQTAKNDLAIDKEMRQRAANRQKVVPLDYAGAADSIAAGRESENGNRAADRRAGVEAAEKRLVDLTTAKQAEREAAKKAAEEIASATGASAASPGEKAATAGAGAATVDSATSKADVAGTFSSVNLGGMSVGSSLQERMAKATEETAKGVKELVGQGGGKVAA